MEQHFVELVFSLPVSNAVVERVFSRINTIKSDHRCSFSEDRLDELVRIAIDGLPLKQWDASLAIKQWWSDKQQRLGQKTKVLSKMYLHLIWEEKLKQHLIWEIGMSSLVS